VFLLQSGGPSFAHIQHKHNWQNYSFVYLSL
jgi:hypothetical protein